MDNGKCAIFVALMTVAVETVTEKSGIMCGKMCHYLKSRLLVLS